MPGRSPAAPHMQCTLQKQSKSRSYCCCRKHPDLDTPLANERAAVVIAASHQRNYSKRGIVAVQPGQTQLKQSDSNNADVHKRKCEQQRTVVPTHSLEATKPVVSAHTSVQHKHCSDNSGRFLGPDPRTCCNIGNHPAHWRFTAPNRALRCAMQR